MKRKNILFSEQDLYDLKVLVNQKKKSASEIVRNLLRNSIRNIKSDVLKEIVFHRSENSRLCALLIEKYPDINIEFELDKLRNEFVLEIK